MLVATGLYVLDILSTYPLTVPKPELSTRILLSLEQPCHLDVISIMIAIPMYDVEPQFPPLRLPSIHFVRQQFLQQCIKAKIGAPNQTYRYRLHRGHIMQPIPLALMQLMDLRVCNLHKDGGLDMTRKSKINACKLSIFAGI